MIKKNEKKIMTAITIPICQSFCLFYKHTESERERERERERETDILRYRIIV